MARVNLKYLYQTNEHSRNNDFVQALPSYWHPNWQSLIDPPANHLPATDNSHMSRLSIGSPRNGWTQLAVVACRAVAIGLGIRTW